MNSKLIKACIAGTAAVAVAAGGTTFAAWSDFGTTSAAAGAGYLKLNITDEVVSSTALSLAPDKNQYLDFLLTSADSGNTPNGKLTVKVADLVDTEDTPGACTTNSESLLETGAVGGDCGTGAGTGELSDEVKVSVKTRAPVVGTECNDLADNTFAEITPPVGTSPIGGGNLPVLSTLFAADGTWTLDTSLTPGEGVCVRVRMFLPSTATNATQGDDAAWNWRFDLVQGA